MRRRILIAVFFLTMLSPIPSGRAEEYVQAHPFPEEKDGRTYQRYVQARAVIGIKTAASGGRYTIDQAASIAERSGVDIIVTADAFLNRWQYGLWPLRKILKKTEETKSVSTYGIRRYLDELEAAGRKNPGTVIVGGLEAAPFYYWEGNPWEKNFAIRDWHKHLLVIGLKTPEDWRGLPVIGNGTSPAKPFGIPDLFHLSLSIAILSAGAFFIIGGRLARDGVYESRFGILLSRWRYIGAALLLAGLIIFVNGFPFRGLIYDQYHGDRGAMPYQNLIDYADKHGGMTFWGHPEAANTEKIGAVSIRTGEHADLLLETCGYTGFAIFYEGYDIVGRPHGVWDSVLRRYCQGGCPSPVWAIGTLDYEREGSLEEGMKNIRTVLLVKEMSPSGAFDALRKGRMYIARDANAARFRLETFTVGDPSGVPATMGEEAVLAGSRPRITIKGRFADNAETKAPLKVLLIRDGEILTVFEAEGAIDITYDDASAEESGRHYYRIEVRSKGLALVSNPVFVTGK